MSRLITNAIRSTSASADAITMDGSGNVTFPANATCSGTATGFGGGKILQVISDTKTDTQSFQSQSFSTISGLSVSITPSSASNKVLVHYSVSVSCNNYGMFNLRRAGSEILRGDADGNRTRCTFESGVMNQYEMQICSGTFLDSPSSTSALTYDIQCATPDSSSSELFINRYKTDNNSSYVGRATSTITVMEVAA
tara:strand:+ start:111 stop:698 length:588 start_codon:yes stop_codon:yes gene_type:complete